MFSGRLNLASSDIGDSFRPNHKDLQCMTPGETWGVNLTFPEINPFAYILRMTQGLMADKQLNMSPQNAAVAKRANAILGWGVQARDYGLFQWDFHGNSLRSL